MSGELPMSRAEAFIGAACLLMDDDGLIVEVQKRPTWQRGSGGLSVGLGCIGGGIEAGETPLEALQREAIEEIGCPVIVRSARMTTEVSAQGCASFREWNAGEPRPVLVWDGRALGFSSEGKGVVYLARPDGVPEPRDLPAIATLSLDQVLDLGSRPSTVAHILSRGAELRQRVPIPTAAVVTLEGTLAVLYRLYTADREAAEGILAELRRQL